MYFRYFLLLCLILILKVCLIVFYISHSGIGLGPEEAQYWIWSQYLDWGYYSKPPGIAWTIWLSTQWLGNTELGVRVGPLVMGTLIPVLVYFMALCCRLVPRACFWAGIMMVCSPMGVLSSLLAVTDVGMVLFWTLACLYIAFNLRNAEPNKNMYLWVGLLIAGGALFKYPIYFLWLCILITWICIPRLRSYQLIWGIVISLIGLLPSFYWNVSHEWVTFKHVSENISGGYQGAKNSFSIITVLEFLGMQIGFVSPLLFVLLLFSFRAMYHNFRTISPGVFFCGSIAFIALAGGIIASFFIKMHGNWAVFAYSTVFVIVSWYVYNDRQHREKWLIRGVCLSVIMIGVVAMIPWIVSQSISRSIPIPYEINPLSDFLGWENLDMLLKEAGYDSNNDYLCSDNRCMTSMLSFYGPQKKRAYFFSLNNCRLIENQYSIWPGIVEEQQGKKGFFIVSQENLTKDAESGKIENVKGDLKKQFQTVNFRGVYPLYFSCNKVMIYEVCDPIIGL